jgi:hypothetical protein
VLKLAFGIDLLVQGVAEAVRAAALSALNGDALKTACPSLQDVTQQAAATLASSAVAPATAGSTSAAAVVSFPACSQRQHPTLQQLGFECIVAQQLGKPYCHGDNFADYMKQHSRTQPNPPMLGLRGLFTKPLDEGTASQRQLRAKFVALALLGTPCATRQLPCGEQGPAGSSFRTADIAAWIPLLLPELYKWALVFPYSTPVSQQLAESVFSQLGSGTDPSATVELKVSTLQSRWHSEELLGENASHPLSDDEAAVARRIQQQLDLQRK